MSETQLTAVISGSFDHCKGPIDSLIDDFADLGVTVLEPTKGWLWAPRMAVVKPQWRPLPHEVGLGLRQIEDRFLAALTIADFHYVYTEGRYVGGSTAFEIGSAVSYHDPEKPIYTAEYISDVVADGDLEHLRFLNQRLAVAGIAEAVQAERQRRTSAFQ